jgi:gamma-glutamyl hercynylcysteine S-oxide synthase
MEQCRLRTLELVRSIDYETFCTQAHPDFSPVGWHLGHIAYTEALWILQRLAGYPPLMPEYHQLFAQDGLPKSERVKLPAIETVLDYLETVRSKVFDYLAIAPIEQQERLWKWLIQHECQHAETIAIMLALIHSLRFEGVQPPKSPKLGDFESREFPVLKSPRLGDLGGDPQAFHAPEKSSEMILIASGHFTQGSHQIESQDNERPPHEIYLNDYWIDRYPVTFSEYQSFIESDAYQNPKFWTAEGWDWVKSNQITKPLYQGEKHEPVYGVSWYEADAYARFVGKRLPTESEWEKAAHAQNMLGEVWQWTNTWFDEYPGFENYPYSGYSQNYFDRKHRVLKGGSWATFPWAMRRSFRNWYYPHVREIFAGFRCVAGERSFV